MCKTNIQKLQIVTSTLIQSSVEVPALHPSDYSTIKKEDGGGVFSKKRISNERIDQSIDGQVVIGTGRFKDVSGEHLDLNETEAH